VEEMSICIIQPVDLAPPGEITKTLDCMGENYKIFPMEKDERLPENIHQYEGLIILGGTMGANDDQEFPFLTEIKETIQQFYQLNKPVLGVCLGAQLIASSFHAKVGKMPALEFGMIELKKTDDGNVDPLFQNLPETFSFMEWHEDYFDLPDEATLLASGSDCKNQAFRIGENIYGVQFHPEVNESILNRWLDEKKDCIELIDPNFRDKAAHVVKPLLSSSKEYCRQLVMEWVTLLRKKRISD
jgi:GMP synthase-like glutamine amidotransferase